MLLFYFDRAMLCFIVFYVLFDYIFSKATHTSTFIFCHFREFVDCCIVSSYLDIGFFARHYIPF